MQFAARTGLEMDGRLCRQSAGYSALPTICGNTWSFDLNFFQASDPTGDYRWRNTSAETAGLIDAVWVHGNSREMTRPQILVPHWKVCIAVERLWAPGTEAPVETRLKLLGPVSRPCINQKPSGYELVAARIHPERVLTTLGLTPADLVDQEVEYTGFKGARQLLSLGEAGADAETVGAALVRALVQLNGDKRASAAAVAAAQIRHQNGDLDSPGVCSELGITSRTLRRIFASELGVTPKYYARTVRLQSLLLYVDHIAEPKWSDIALSFGFFDQSHMCAEVKTMTGQTVTELHAQRLGQTSLVSAS